MLEVWSIPAHRRLRQKNYPLEASLSYIKKKPLGRKEGKEKGRRRRKNKRKGEREGGRKPEWEQYLQQELTIHSMVVLVLLAHL